MKPTLQHIWMNTALELANRSECSRAQVGCIITTSDLRHVLGNGYNGFAKGVKYKCEVDNCNCLHSENNAVIDSGSEIKDKVFFITMFPCLSCAIQIINSGCSRLYYNQHYRPESNHWKNEKLINKMFKSSKIKVEQL